MDMTTTCLPLLAQCINIMKSLELVRGYLRPVPVTLTALATECFLLHQALIRLRRCVLDTAGEGTDLLDSLDPFFLGCQITLSAVKDSADQMCHAMSFVRSLELPELVALGNPRLQQIWEEEHMKQFQLQLSAYRQSLPELPVGDTMTAVEQVHSSPEIDPYFVIAQANHARFSFGVRPSSRNSSNQGSILDPAPMYALSLHSITRGYEYSGSISPAPQAPDHHLDNIRLMPHDPEEAMLASFLGSAARNLDIFGVSTATPDRIRQIQLQSTNMISYETLKPTVAASLYEIPTKRQFAPRPQDRRYSKYFNVVVVGGIGVDKSALVLQFILSRYVEESDPTIEESYRKRIIVDGTPAVVDVLDTAGQEEYSAMREQYIRTGEGFVFVYSITSRESFDKVRALHDHISSGRNTLIYPQLLVANHCERNSDRQVSELEGKAMAERLGCEFVEASSTVHANIEHVFESIVREIRHHDAMGTTLANQSGFRNATKPLGRPQGVQGDTISRVDELREAGNRLLYEGPTSKRSTSFFRRRLKRAVE